MDEHLTSVNTELLHTQRLVDAKIKEIETEDHLKQLAERERGRFHVEYKKLQTELVELHDKVNAVQGTVFKVRHAAAARRPSTTPLRRGRRRSSGRGRSRRRGSLRGGRLGVAARGRSVRRHRRDGVGVLCAGYGGLCTKVDLSVELQHAT